MMFKKFIFKMIYIGEIFIKILLFFYVSSELNMIIMFLDEYVELSIVEKEVIYEKFIEWIRLDKMDEEEVEVFFLKFKLEENYNMNDVFYKLGMIDVFGGRVDFFGMFFK